MTPSWRGNREGTRVINYNDKTGIRCANGKTNAFSVNFKAAWKLEAKLVNSLSALRASRLTQILGCGACARRAEIVS